MYHGFNQSNLICNGRNGVLVFPLKNAPGNPWIWRTEFLDAWPEVDLALLRLGFHLAYIDVQNMYGAPCAIDIMDAFYDTLTKTYRLSEKPVLEGFSRGGLFAFNWSIRNPQKVGCIYADAPVCDFKSWPGGFGMGPGSKSNWEECLQVYGITEREALIYKNPVDHLEILKEYNVPIVIVAGMIDEVLPVEENSLVVVDRYKKLSGNILFIQKPFCLHHPHSLSHPTPVVSFILHNCTPSLVPDYHVPEDAKLPYGYDYFRVRTGLSNSFFKFNSVKTARVGFLGGSITNMEGWRNLVCDHLVKRFPHVVFDFVAAGIPSTDSTFHAHRYKRDLLKNGALDLLIVEAAVNDSTNGRSETEMARGMEGVVRQARMDNPTIDIVMLHFADPQKLEEIRMGKTPSVIVQHEKVADRYGIPSINLATEVAERIAAGEFSWEVDFVDLHPAPFGHQLYANSMSRLFDECFRNDSLSGCGMDIVKEYALPEPIDKFSYCNGKFHSIQNAVLESGWSIDENWAPSDNISTRAGFVNIPVLKATEAGAKLKLSFSGCSIGMLLLAGPDTGKISYSIDGALSGTINTVTKWSHNLYLPWVKMFAAGLPDGDHEIEITLLSGNLKIVSFLNQV